MYIPGHACTNDRSCQACAQNYISPWSTANFLALSPKFPLLGIANSGFDHRSGQACRQQPFFFSFSFSSSCFHYFSRRFFRSYLCVFFLLQDSLSALFLVLVFLRDALLPVRYLVRLLPMTFLCSPFPGTWRFSLGYFFALALVFSCTNPLLFCRFLFRCLGGFRYEMSSSLRVFFLVFFPLWLGWVFFLVNFFSRSFIFFFTFGYPRTFLLVTLLSLFSRGFWCPIWVLSFFSPRIFLLLFFFFFHIDGWSWSALVSPWLRLWSMSRSYWFFSSRASLLGSLWPLGQCRVPDECRFFRLLGSLQLGWCLVPNDFPMSFFLSSRASLLGSLWPMCHCRVPNECCFRLLGSLQIGCCLAPIELLFFVIGLVSISLIDVAFLMVSCSSLLGVCNPGWYLALIVFLFVILHHRVCFLFDRGRAPIVFVLRYWLCFNSGWCVPLFAFCVPNVSRSSLWGVCNSGWYLALIAFFLKFDLDVLFLVVISTLNPASFISSVDALSVFLKASNFIVDFFLPFCFPWLGAASILGCCLCSWVPDISFLFLFLSSVRRRWGFCPFSRAKVCPLILVVLSSFFSLICFIFPFFLFILDYFPSLLSTACSLEIIRFSFFFLSIYFSPAESWADQHQRTVLFLALPITMMFFLVFEPSVTQSGSIMANSFFFFLLVILPSWRKGVMTLAIIRS